MATWHCIVGGAQYGPVEESVLRDWIREGRVAPDTLIWTAGMEQWLPAGSVTGFFIGGAAPQAAPPYSLVTVVGPPAASGATPNAQLNEQALGRLTGNWALPIVACLIAAILQSGGGLPLVGPIVALIIAGPIRLGLTAFFLTVARGGRPDLGMIFHGFRFFANALIAYLAMALFIFLWSLLLIVPGIIASLAYSQTFLLMAEDSRLGPLEALRLSKQIMMGKKWKFFCLGWRFFGWILLCMLSCGIGFLWLAPYMTTACARFHDDIHAHPAEQSPAA